MQKNDTVLVDVDSDDEWITKKEDPLLPEDPSWLDKENLFAVDVVRTVPLVPYENDFTHESDIGNLRDTSEVGPYTKKKTKTLGKLQYSIAFLFSCMLLVVILKLIFFFSFDLQQETSVQIEADDTNEVLVDVEIDDVDLIFERDG